MEWHNEMEWHIGNFYVRGVAYRKWSGITDKYRKIFILPFPVSLCLYPSEISGYASARRLYSNHHTQTITRPASRPIIITSSLQSQHPLGEGEQGKALVPLLCKILRNSKSEHFYWQNLPPSLIMYSSVSHQQNRYVNLSKIFKTLSL